MKNKTGEADLPCRRRADIRRRRGADLGSGGAFPSGLVIGTLTAVQTEAGGQIEYGIVEPQCDLDSLVQVFIIKSFEVVE